MPRLPRISGTDVIRALRQAGWMEVRRRGSHVVLRREGRPAPIVVPVHAGTILKPKTLLSIIDAAGMSPEELRRLL